MDEKKLIVLEGATASGKTSLAIEWALKYNTEIISADSRQIYKELRIGVARPSEAELSKVPHHFIACKSIHDYYSVYQYQQEVLALLEQLFKRHDTVILTGGTGLYIKAVCEGIDEFPDPDPVLRERLNNMSLSELQAQLKLIDPDFYNIVALGNPARLRRALEVCYTTGKPYSEQRTHTPQKRSFEIERHAINMPRKQLFERIEKRVDIMLEEGLLEEARTLYPFRHLGALRTVGYRELFEYFDGKISFEQAVTDIKTNTRRYARRQITWLRREGFLMEENAKLVAELAPGFVIEKLP
ncbi:MAG: tRNA (adenosine(37)-N6)-dimethylallyltransferase MiaA [Bacteroidales bacterium]|jgi:tRNA dimethylallyltransferase|nr:tRNA (adenosine(37)-N6)-dimethylallyltransferase MiaA [Bacteroidales bacterium]